MKVKVTVEQDRCDLCENEAAYSGACLGCGKTFCYEHKKTHAIEAVVSSRRTAEPPTHCQKELIHQSETVKL